MAWLRDDVSGMHYMGITHTPEWMGFKQVETSETVLLCVCVGGALQYRLGVSYGHMANIWPI